MNVTEASQRLRLLLRDRDGPLCHWCGVELNFQLITPKGSPRATIEHLLPRCQGGKTTPDNIRLACISCNTKRHNRGWVPFRADRQAEIAQRLAEKNLAQHITEHHA